MSGSTTNLDLISSSQASKEVTANALFDAGSPATLYGRRASTTANLTWGYYGGYLSITGTPTAIANGTVALSNANTNYITAARATGNVTASTSNTSWNDTANHARLYSVVTAGNLVTSYVDVRSFALGENGTTVYAPMAGNASQVFSVAPATAAAHAVRSDQLSYNNTIFPLITYSDAYTSINNITHGGTLTVTMKTTKIGRQVTVNLTYSDTVSTSATLNSTVFSLEYAPATNACGGNGANMSTGSNMGLAYVSTDGNMYLPTCTTAAGQPASFTVVYFAAS